ncbi:hypothetical protein CPB85DRAFT_1256063 [Mucidula mucida]|nr:hypothetical protein CPB85DRAFT_1256063 [Mucidula mucida]
MIQGHWMGSSSTSRFLLVLALTHIAVSITLTRRACLLKRKSSDITELKLEDETRATNDLTPHSKTDGFKQEAFPAYSNTSLPSLASGPNIRRGSTGPLKSTPTRFNEKSQACFILIHRGSVQSIISRSVREPLSQDEQWPERRPELQLRNRIFGEAQLVSKDSNSSEHNTTFKDDYTRYATLQTGNFTRNDAYFSLKKAPLGQKTAELGLRAYTNQIHGSRVQI